MPRKCVNTADNFCYICGEVTFANQKKSINSQVKKAHHLYFGCKVGDQAYMLCYMYNTAFTVVELQKVINAVCSPNGVERAKQPPK